MKKKKLLLVLGIVILAFFFLLNEDNDKDLGDNYYQVINREVLDENVLEEGEYSWSYFGSAQENVDDDVTGIVKKIVAGDNVVGLESKEVMTIQNIYNKAIDMEQRDEDGIVALEGYLTRVWNVSSVEALVDVIAVVEDDLGLDLLMNVEIMADYRDNSKNMIYFVPVTFAFGAGSDYMVDDDYMVYKAYIRRACVQLWKVYGKDTKEAREIVERVFSFYEDVANHSKLAGELDDVVEYYQVVSEEEFVSIMGNIGEKYLSRRGLEDRDVYSLVDKEQYQYLMESLTLDNLEVWKEVIVTKILSSYASYGSSDYVQIVDDLNEALLGDDEEETIDENSEEQAVDLITNLFSSEIDEVYAKSVLTEENVLAVEEMFLEIKEVYRNRLKNNEWLSEEAIEKALVKLDKMEVIVGIDEENVGFEIASKLEISDDSLIKDVIAIQQLVWKEELRQLDSGRKINLVSQSVVNAYYQPLDNLIVIPVAFFELVGEEEDYYKRLGTLGMILSHEVTHAFDGNGSQFDEDGNLNDWWTDEDKNNFERLKQEVGDYYSGYEVLDGKYINGEKTVNENIADLGAVACISEIAKKNGASEDEMMTMYSSFAGIWASHESEEYMDLLLLQDVHAPNQFRVNAVLSSTDEFYQVYQVYPWNEMWVDDDKRVSVW